MSYRRCRELAEKSVRFCMRRRVPFTMSHSQHTFYDKKVDYLFPRLPPFPLPLTFTFHLLTSLPQTLSYRRLIILEYLEDNSTIMSLTPLYPRGLASRPKVVVRNRQEDMTKVEELADKRVLAAVVASLDMKVCLTYFEIFLSPG